MRMLIHSILIILSGVLAPVEPRLSQRVVDINNTAMYQCYVRYVCGARQQDVLVLHTNHADLSQYVTCIRSPFTVVYLNLVRDMYSREVPEILKPSARGPYALVVLIMATARDLIFYDRFLHKMSHRNLAARFLLVALGGEQRLDRILQQAWFVNVFNIAVLRRNDTRVYTYFPYAGGVRDWRIHAEVLGQCQQLSFDDLYPAKVPKQCSGCSMPVTSRTLPPAILDSLANSQQPLVVGYEVALINIICERLNFTKLITPQRLMRNMDCSHSYPYHTDTLVWHAPAAGPGPQWKSLVLVFQAPLWYAVLAGFLLNTLAWWVLGRAYSTAAASYVDCVLGSLLVLLNGSVPLPRHTGMRFFVACWTLCALVLVAAYQCQFLSILLTPVYEKQIASEREMLATNLTIHLRTELLRPFRSSSSHFIVDIIERSVQTMSDPEKGDVFLQYTLTTKYRAKSYPPDLYLFKKPVLYKPLCLDFDAGDPVVDYANKFLRLLVENGIVAKFMRDMDFSTQTSLDDPGNVQITMHHLEFAFFALLLGYTLATMMFVLEEIVWHAMQKWRGTAATRTTKWRGTLLNRR